MTHLKQNYRFLLTIIFISIFLSSHAQGWEWAKKVGGDNFNYGSNIVYDGTKYFYTIGSFKGTAILPSGNLTATGNQDIYIAKIDQDGNFIWTIQVGGNSDPSSLIHVYGLDYSKGKLYLTGSFGGNISFGSYNLNCTGNCTVDIFAARYDTLGNAEHAVRIGGAGGGRGCSIAANDQGDYYVTGFFEGTFNFGSYSKTSQGGYDMFLVKFSSYNNVEWVKTYGDSLWQFSYDIAIDNSGNPIISGSFEGDLNFGSTTLSNQGKYDVFVAKFNQYGSFLWANKGGGTATDQCYSLCIDTNDDVIITGLIGAYAMFGSVNLNCSGYSDFFISKYSNSGNHLWVRNFGGNQADDAWAITSDELNNIYVSGRISGQAQFDSISLSVNQGNPIIVKLNGAGNVIMAQSTIGSASGAFADITVDNSYNVYVTGTFGYTPNQFLIFGNTQLYNDSLQDGLIAKYSDTYDSFEEYESKMKVLVYPSITSDFIQVEIDNNSWNGEAVISIFDLAGNHLYTSSYKAIDKIQLDVKDFPNGLYFIQINTTSGNASRKFIINK